MCGKFAVRAQCLTSISYKLWYNIRPGFVLHRLESRLTKTPFVRHGPLIEELSNLLRGTIGRMLQSIVLQKLSATNKRNKDSTYTKSVMLKKNTILKACRHVDRQQALRAADPRMTEFPEYASLDRYFDCKTFEISSSKVNSIDDRYHQEERCNCCVVSFRCYQVCRDPIERSDAVSSRKAKPECKPENVKAAVVVWVGNSRP